MQLMIQNEGVAPPEAFTSLGYSGTRGRDNEGLIGQFGSGNKHGINLMLRNRIPLIAFIGKIKLTFFTEVEYITEADGTVVESYPVKCRLSGAKNKTINCGWTLKFGELDWTKTSMALREFVSNAIDCSKVMGTDPVIRPEANARAKAGTTRIFVDLSHPDVAEFHRDLGKHFLHFSGDPSQVTQKFLKKSPESGGPNVFREGVITQKLQSSHPAVFDYNFRADEIEIDECRNSSEYSLRASIARILNEADSETLATLFTAMEKDNVFEASLDEFYLSYIDNDRIKSNWIGAWESFAGDAVISNETVGSSLIADHVRSKGHKVKVIKSDTFVKVAQKMGVPGVAFVLGEAAANGNVPVEVTKDAIEAVNTVWNWCEKTGLTDGKDKPNTSCFKQLMKGESECLGYFPMGGDTVYLRDDLAGKIALKTAIEEVAHYVTSSTDCSRDFQNFAFDMIVELNS